MLRNDKIISQKQNVEINKEKEGSGRKKSDYIKRRDLIVEKDREEETRLRIFLPLR